MGYSLKFSLFTDMFLYKMDAFMETKTVHLDDSSYSLTFVCLILPSINLICASRLIDKIYCFPNNAQVILPGVCEARHIYIYHYIFTPGPFGPYGIVVPSAVCPSVRPSRLRYHSTAHNISRILFISSPVVNLSMSMNRIDYWVAMFIV